MGFSIVHCVGLGTYANIAQVLVVNQSRRRPAVRIFPQHNYHHLQRQHQHNHHHHHPHHPLHRRHCHRHYIHCQHCALKRFYLCNDMFQVSSSSCFPNRISHANLHVGGFLSFFFFGGQISAAAVAASVAFWEALCLHLIIKIQFSQFTQPSVLFIGHLLDWVS